MTTDMIMTICEEYFVFHNSSTILVCNQSRQHQWYHHVHGLYSVCAVKHPNLILIYGCDTGVYQCNLDESLTLCSETQLVDYAIPFRQVRWDYDLCLLSYSSTQL